MKNDLEKYIKEHRDEFDTHDPPERTWEAINKKMQRKEHSSHRRYYAAIAAVLLVILSSAWWLLPGDMKHTPLAATAPVKAPVQIADAEGYYAVIVETKQAELNKYTKEYPELCKDFAKEIDTLNSMYGQLKTEYNDAAGNEAVLQAMLENLKTQVRILSMQLQILQNIKNKENKPHLKIA